MRTTAVIVIIISLMAMTTLAEESLTREEQIEIIENYMYITGQRENMSSAALADEERFPHDVPIKCGTPAVHAFTMNYDRLDKSLLKSCGVELVERPDLPYSVDSPEGLFRIHYATSGNDAVYHAGVDNDGNDVPDYCDQVAQVMDSVYHYMFDTLGYPIPPRDGYEPGGDDKWDVYLQNLSNNFYGLTQSDSLYYDGPGSKRATSYIVINSNLSQLPSYENDPLGAIQVTCAHEFFHVVQFGIDFREAEGAYYERQYWMEISAVWMEEEQYDNVNDYYTYLPYFFNCPNASLQQFNGMMDQHPYGSAIFAIHLSEKYGRDIIKDIWLRCGELGLGPSFLKAADAAIDSASGGTESWETNFSEFALWNYFTGSRADMIPDGVTGYSEKENYPGFPDEVIRTFNYYPIVVMCDVLSPQHNGAYYLKLDDLWLTSIIPDSTCWICDTTAGTFPNCSDSFQVRDTVGWFPPEYPNSPYTSFTWHIDSNYNVALALGDGDYILPLLPSPWGVKILYEEVDSPDNLIMESLWLPDQQLWAISLLDYKDYQSLTFVLTPASTERYFYDNPDFRIIPLGYSAGESSFDSNLVNIPPAVLSPYPNPVVVADMGNPKVTFRFQVPTGSDSKPIYGMEFDASDPYLLVDIYTLAGERVKALDITTDKAVRLGIYYTEWDLTNESGRNVASGVYVAYARLYSKAHRGVLVAEDKAKVAVIR
ncbi:MAG: MXAN_6640 family putative metalloprotease [candidate division Zixibacteria bacterium]|nr:MXAN_6640 family putative metalloprotease [candidate division Zixibacteria bacterium]